MNILFISFGLAVTVGGTERVTRVLMNSFQASGHHCFITYCTGEDEAFPHDHKLLVNYRDTYSKFEKKMNLFFEYAHADVIINENVCECNVSKWLKKKKKECKSLPIIYCLHNTPEIFVRPIEGFGLSAIKNRLFKIFTGKTIYMWKHQKMYNVCDHYVVLSESYIDEFYRIFRQHNSGKVISISNPISMQTDGYKIKKENIFLVVARLSEKQKNISDILRIWKQFSSQNVDYKLQIVGYGPDEQYLHEYAKSLHLERVEFLGKTNNPQKFYAHAKFFLMTSHFEGLPMTIIEAMQFNSIPIVYDSFAAIKDIVKNGENGILVPPHDRQAFLQAMNSLVENEEKQEEIRTNLCPSLHKFSIESIVKQWEKILRNN